MKRNRNPQGSKKDSNQINLGNRNKRTRSPKALLYRINQLQIYFHHPITPLKFRFRNRVGWGSSLGHVPTCLGRGEEGSLMEHRPVGLQQGKSRPPQENQSAGLAK